LAGEFAREGAGPASEGVKPEASLGKVRGGEAERLCAFSQKDKEKSVPWSAPCRGSWSTRMLI